MAGAVLFQQSSGGCLSLLPIPYLDFASFVLLPPTAQRFRWNGLILTSPRHDNTKQNGYMVSFFSDVEVLSRSPLLFFLVH